MVRRLPVHEIACRSKLSLTHGYRSAALPRRKRYGRQLTPRGTAKVKCAWTVNLASLRTRFLDHIEPTAVSQVADALSAVALHLQANSSVATRTQPPPGG
jgi:hypothetical protein